MTKPSFADTKSRRLTVALLAALLALPMLGTAKAASLDEIKKRGLIVATEDDFRPFEFVKDGKPTGFDNELIEDLRKYAPFEIKQQILPWTGILAGVSTGKYDVAITAAIITKERKKSLDFTSPIADATHYYVKRKDDSVDFLHQGSERQDRRRSGRQRAARPSSRTRHHAREGGAASSARSSSTRPIRKPIRIWRSAVSIMSSTPSST